MDHSTEQKLDQPLKRALELTDDEHELCVVARLNVGRSSEPEPDKIEASQFESRRAYRQALIDARKRSLKESIGPVVEALESMGLRVEGGNLQRAVVLRGPTRAMKQAVELPGVEHAALDAELGLEPEGERAQPPQDELERSRRTEESDGEC